MFGENLSYYIKGNRFLGLILMYGKMDHYLCGRI
jgi:hypothetical protein